MLEGSTPGTVQRRDHGGVAVLAFARPPVNAIDLPTVRALHDHLAALVADKSCLGVVLTGEGPAFNAGIDHRVVPTYDDERRAEMIAVINRTLQLLYGMPKPTVAAINGHALGGGLVVALACDVRFAADAEFRLGLPEVTAGIPFPAVPLVITRHELEPSVARHLMLSGSTVTPQDHLALRFLDALTAPERLLASAISEVHTRAALPAFAVVKQQLKEPALRAIDNIVAGGTDPLLANWF